ncbi:P-loop containing nucleoside triphosphate hydrolase protein [Xylaria longipes]|nr:P-loop containing nucleoside triphosphate hydrolase protein [Xylaria longipes]RYC56624.1 hypothetical protein CHU98_g9585 [Xylaria longipes]
MAERMAISFGDSNYGFQVGQNSGSIAAEFHLAPERPETPPKPSSFIPFCRDSRFVERKAILDQLRQACSTPPSRAALVGLGGVGKSQLAIEYAYRVRDAFAQQHREIWVFWVHAGTRARVEQGFKAIADAVKIRGRSQPNADILQLIYQWLCNEHNGQWLMVLDSADDASVLRGVSQDGKQAATAGEQTKALLTYLPQSPNGSIILTTRDKDLAFRLTGHQDNIIEVGPMDDNHALELLERKMGSQPGLQFDKANGAKLVNALGHMPLAIGQAAAYIQRRAPRTSIKKYLEEFRQNEQKQLNLLNHDSGDLRRDPSTSNSVIATWQISFEHIRSQEQSATDLLSLMSFFDCQGIQEYLVRPGPRGKNRDYKAHSGDESVDTNETLNGIFENDVATLRNYCLISANETDDTFEMHGLVQLSTRKWLGMHKKTDTFKMACVSRLAWAFPEPVFSNWPTCRLLYPHIEEAVHYCVDDKESKVLKDFEQILRRGGQYSKEQGRYATAERMLKKALATAKNVFGAGHENTAGVMNELAQVCLHQNRSKDAEQLFKEALKIRESALEPDHPNTLATMNNLALAYMDQCRWDEAELLSVQVIERENIVLGPDHPDTLSSMHSLAYTYNGQKRWQEAELLLVEVVKGRKRVLGPDHPYILISIHNLASVYKDQERWQEAELLLKEVVEERKRVLGPDHPDTLTSMAWLADSQKGLGYTDEAIESMEQCAQAHIRFLGRDDPRTRNMLSTLQGWRAEKSQTQERRLKPMVGNRMTSMAAKFRKLDFRRRRHDDSAGPSS